MASNRTQPFGYKVEVGMVANHPVEYGEVQYIYDTYELGATFQMLADDMQKKGIPYDGDKTWNKNMIARILADPRYMGVDGYPQIITERQFRAVAERRRKRTVHCRKSPMQRRLKMRYGVEATPNMELNVRHLLESLMQNPMRIIVTQCKRDLPDTVSVLQEKLDVMLKAMPVEEQLAKQTVMRLTEARYSALGNEEYETLRLRRIFQSIASDADVDEELMRQTVAAVIVVGEMVSLRLRNGQTIG